MANHPPSLAPGDPYRWHESVLSTRSLSYLSTISALGTGGLPSPLASRNTSTAHPYAHPQSNMDEEDSEYELEMASRKEKAKAVRETLPFSVAHSMLFALPREIRDRIYHYCLVATSRPTVDWPPPTPFTLDVAPQLLQTCKIVYTEAAPIMYTHNQFSFAHPTDANIFVRAMSSPLHSGMIANLNFYLRTQDTRLWMSYLISSYTSRSLKHDFPSLRELTIRYKSVKWSHHIPAEANVRMWHEDRHLDELTLSLRHLYYPPLQDLDLTDLDAQQHAMLKAYEDADAEMQESVLDPAVREKLQELHQLRGLAVQKARAPRIRIICMCRVPLAQFQALTSTQDGPDHMSNGYPGRTNLGPVQQQGVDAAQMPHDVRTAMAQPSAVVEGSEFLGFSAIDLKGRATRVPASASPSGTNAWVARTVFLNRKYIMLALEIYAHD